MTPMLTPAGINNGHLLISLDLDQLHICANADNGFQSI